MRKLRPREVKWFVHISSSNRGTHRWRPLQALLALGVLDCSISFWTTACLQTGSPVELSFMLHPSVFLPLSAPFPKTSCQAVLGIFHSRGGCWAKSGFLQIRKSRACLLRCVQLEFLIPSRVLWRLLGNSTKYNPRGTCALLLALPITTCQSRKVLSWKCKKSPRSGLLKPGCISESLRLLMKYTICPPQTY